MTTTETHYEWGYRLADGTEMWQMPHKYGASIPALGDGGSRVLVGGVEIIGDDPKAVAASIAAVLARFGKEGHVLRRRVTITTGDVERVHPVSGRKMIESSVLGVGVVNDKGIGCEILADGEPGLPLYFP